MKQNTNQNSSEATGYLRSLLLALFFLIILFTSPIWIWLAYPYQSLNLLIVDKSVPDQTYREHSTLVWVINHLKISAPDQAWFWKAEQDYLGYQPPDPQTGFKGQGTPLDENALKDKKLLFIADSYGVYRKDLQDPLYEYDGPDYSPIVFGGLDDQEVTAIENFSQAGGHLIGEFNTFASPTKGAPRQRLETLFGTKWSGWAARYFEDLGDEHQVPRWAHRNWRNQYGEVWPHQGPGWLFIHESSTIFVLKQDQDMGPWTLRLHQLQKSHPLLQGAYDRVPFYFWFDILEPFDKSQVLAEYRMDLTPSGKEKIKKFGVPETFPAMILAQSQPLRLYLVGDCSDNPVEPGPFYMLGRQWLEGLGRFNERHHDQRAFFWEFYLPVLKNVFQHLNNIPEN